MKTYTVYGEVTVGVSITVEAENEDEAKEIAEENFGGIKSYCGNGGTNKLIGVSSSDETISADYGEVTWTEATEE